MSASSVKWVKIGSYIEQYFVRNSDGLYGESDAIGVNIEKEILPMRGNISEKDFTPQRQIRNIASHLQIGLPQSINSKKIV